jgi:hypothetical protein
MEGEKGKRERERQTEMKRMREKERKIEVERDKERKSISFITVIDCNRGQKLPDGEGKQSKSGLLRKSLICKLSPEIVTC